MTSSSSSSASSCEASSMMSPDDCCLGCIMAGLCFGGDRIGTSCLFGFSKANLGVALNCCDAVDFGVTNWAGDGLAKGGCWGVGLLWKRRLDGGFGVAFSFGGLLVMKRRGDGVYHGINKHQHCLLRHIGALTYRRRRHGGRIVPALVALPRFSDCSNRIELGD